MGRVFFTEIEPEAASELLKRVRNPRRNLVAAGKTGEGDSEV